MHNSNHWRADLPSNLLALAAGLTALLLAFGPAGTSFHALAVSSSAQICSTSPACESVSIQGPTNTGEAWTVRIAAKAGASVDEMARLKEAFLAEVIRDKRDVNLVVTGQPATAPKKKVR